MPGLLSILNLIVVAVIGIWGVLQIRVTKQLEEKIHRLNIELDQSIQLLYRARDAVINSHRAYIHMLILGRDGYTGNLESLGNRFSEFSVYEAELHGLAIAIDDKELLEIVNESYKFFEKPLKERVVTEDEVDIRFRSQRLHTRISELLRIATKE